MAVRHEPVVILECDRSDRPAHTPAAFHAGVGTAGRDSQAQPDRLATTGQRRELGHQLDLLTDAEGVGSDETDPRRGVRSTI